MKINEVFLIGFYGGQKNNNKYTILISGELNNITKMNNNIYYYSFIK
jgi:hypothetical protein